MLILTFMIVIIIFMCVKGWQIALTEKLHEEAEEYAEKRYNEYVKNIKCRIHITQRIVDEMNRR